MAADRHGNGRTGVWLAAGQRRGASWCQMVNPAEGSPSRARLMPRAQGAPPYAAPPAASAQTWGLPLQPAGTRAQDHPETKPLLSPVSPDRVPISSLLTMLKNPQTRTWRVLRGRAWRQQAPRFREATCPAGALESWEGQSGFGQLGH